MMRTCHSYQKAQGGHWGGSSPAGRYMGNAQLHLKNVGLRCWRVTSAMISGGADLANNRGGNGGPVHENTHTRYETDALCLLA